MVATMQIGCTNAPTKPVSPAGNARLNASSEQGQTAFPAVHRVHDVAENRRTVCLPRKERGRGRRRDVRSVVNSCWRLVSIDIRLAGASEDADISSPNTRQRRSSPDERNGSYDVMADHGPSPGNISTDTTAGDMDESGQERPQSTPSLGNSMMRTVVSSGNDALNILFEAAAAHSRGNGMGPDAQPGNNTSSESRAARNENSWTGGDSAAPFHVATRTVYPVEISQASKEVLEVWEACRFVKMGWFTSKEAVTLIDLFVHPIRAIWRIH